MRSSFLFAPLVVVASVAFAESPSVDSIYTKWCDNQAAVERVSDDIRATHIAACVEALEEADRNPDAGKKKDGDDEG